MHSVNTRPSGRRRPTASTALLASLLALGAVATACGSDSPSSSPSVADTVTTLVPTTIAATVPETVAETVAPTVADTIAVETTVDGPIVDTGMPEAADYTEYVKLVDDSGTLTMEVPAEWVDVETTAIDNGGALYPTIEASTDLAVYSAGFDVPGARFMSMPIPASNVLEVLDVFSVQECVAGEIKDYDDGVFAGKYQLYTACGGGSAAFFVLVTSLATDPATTYVTTVQAVTSADLTALDHILGSFNIVT